MTKCLRAGCHNPQSPEDRLQIGLCEHHYTQLRAGTIGQDIDTRQKQHTANEARAILTRISEPSESVRAIAARTGMSKDSIHHLRKGSWQHVRSHVWEQLQEALARQDYEKARREHHAGQ